MTETAIWRRLDRPGHGAARLRRRDAGWLLQGTAAFVHEGGPASVAYQEEVDADWSTTRGNSNGFLGENAFQHQIRRARDGWRLNGSIVDGLGHLADLDHGFTPATNILQLQRAAPSPGQKISLPVVWFDLDSATLIELP